MINKLVCLVFIQLLFITLCQQIYCQDVNRRVLKFTSGSGGVLFSGSTEYIHLATVGETISGESQNQDQLVRSGFWSYTPLGPTSADDNKRLTTPDKFQLYQNYPNPFNPTTSISYDLPEASIVKIEIYNMLGEMTIELINSESRDAGHYSVIWNGTDKYGHPVSSGLYIYRIEARSEINSLNVFQSIKKMILLR